MLVRDFFPLGKAYDDAFCNRVEETQWVLTNIKKGKHSLLIAPRRYGKSSLAERALAKSKLPCVEANFHLCTSDEEVCDLIVDAVGRLIGRSLGSVEKIIGAIKKMATHFHPKISLAHEMVSLELVPTDKKNLAKTVSEALLLAERLLKSKKKQAVLFFDEFQEIARITKTHAMEGAIRTAAQDMKQITIIFSGSHRSLLVSMFDDESRPLYKLCRKLALTLISKEHYRLHLNKLAQKQWRRKLPDEVFERIIQLTHRHPYYVNYICDIIWDSCKKVPAVEAVNKAWRMVLEEERTDSFKDFGLLSMTQRRVIKLLASETVKNVMSRENCKRLDLSASTISFAIENLVDKDYIEMLEDGYRVINPMLASVLNEETNF